MAVLLRDVLETTARGCRVRFEHCGQLLEAELVWPPERARERLGEPLQIELGHEGIRGWRRCADDADSSGLFAVGPNETRIVGRVHNVIALDDGVSVYDVYLTNGPEFAAFDSDELGDSSLAKGVALEVTVLGLCLYPTNT